MEARQPPEPSRREFSVRTQNLIRIFDHALLRITKLGRRLDHKLKILHRSLAGAAGKIDARGRQCKNQFWPECSKSRWFFPNRRSTAPPPHQSQFSRRLLRPPRRPRLANKKAWRLLLAADRAPEGPESQLGPDFRVAASLFEGGTEACLQHGAMHCREAVTASARLPGNIPK
jgi:hypothetical protein